MGFSGNYQLWLSPIDRHGREIHADVIQSAEAIGNSFFIYRQGEIQCESVSNALVQNTVEWTSRIHRKRTIDNLHAYLLQAYRKNVDKFLNRQGFCSAQGRTMAVPDDRLEPSRKYRTRCREVERIEGRVLLREITEMMKPEAQAVFSYRIQGHNMDDIAQHLGANRRYMAKRYFRGLAAAVEMGLPGLDIKFGSHGRYKPADPGAQICG